MRNIFLKKFMNVRIAHQDISVDSPLLNQFLVHSKSSIVTLIRQHANNAINTLVNIVPRGQESFSNDLEHFSFWTLSVSLDDQLEANEINLCPISDQSKNLQTEKM